MHPFWSHTIEPLLDAADAKAIAEIGAEQARTTRLLLARAERVGGMVHAIDPAPRFDVSKTELEHGERFRFHRAKSVDVIGRITGLDAVLIDGDHNWHTVHSELNLIAARTDADGRPLPLIIAHDVGWPYGRRDMYYDPKSLPDTARQDAARSGIVPGSSELHPGGINPTYWNATKEGGPRNGVRTAIEDFISERAADEIELVVIEGWHGLGVLASGGRIAARPELADAIASLRSPDYLNAQLIRIERARIDASQRAARTASQTTAARRSAASRDLGLLDEDAPGET